MDLERTSGLNRLRKTLFLDDFEVALFFEHFNADCARLPFEKEVHSAAPPNPSRINTLILLFCIDCFSREHPVA